MNMKKSIAGVMAGAMAVSAMATTASAWSEGTGAQEQIVLSYDLKTYGMAWEDGVVTVKRDYTNTTDVNYIVENLGTKDTNGDGKVEEVVDVTFGGKLANYSRYDLMAVQLDVRGTKQTDDITNSDKVLYTNASIGTNLDNEAIKVTGTQLLKEGNNVYAYKIPFSTSYLKGAFNMNGYKVMSATKTDGLETYDNYFDAEEASKKEAVYNYVEVETESTTWVDKTGKEYGDWLVTVDNSERWMGTVAVPAKEALMPAVEPTWKTNGDGTGYIGSFEIDGVTFYLKDCAKTGADYADMLTKNSWEAYEYDLDEKKALQYVAVPAGTVVEVEAAGTEKVCRKGTYYLINANGNRKEKVVASESLGYGFKSYTVTMTYYVNAADWNYEGRVAVSNENTGITGMANVDDVYNYSGGNGVPFAKPMKSSIDKPADVIWQLNQEKGEWGGSFYTKPIVVLNDILANNENVSFTFHTFAGKVDNREYIKAEVYDAASKKARIKNPAGGLETITPTDVLVKGSDTYVNNPYRGFAHDGGDWYNPYFAQHLYGTGTYDKYDYNKFGPNNTQTVYDMFGSYAADWNTNLFTGGLVVNSEWTMQLSDTDAFEWGDSTLTFYWKSITKEDMALTNAKNFIQSIALYTPVDWYWDKMDVAVGAAVVEEVPAGAGQEDDAEEVVEEEIVEEEIIEEEIVEEEVIEEEIVEEEEFIEEEEEIVEEEEEIVEEEEVVEEEVVVEEESPKTGNASVALAVIPVALAAAAVVAKKRN